MSETETINSAWVLSPEEAKLILKHREEVSARREALRDAVGDVLGRFYSADGHITSWPGTQHIAHTILAELEARGVLKV